MTSILGDFILDLPEQHTKVQAFNRLRSNVKGSIDIDLAPCTAIVGPNKSNKTSILDTIRLALTGKHPVGGLPSDLVELMPDDALRMSATLSGPSGIVHWVLEVPEGKAKRPEPPVFRGSIEALSATERERILTLDGIVEMIRFGKDRMREALMGRFGAATDVSKPVGLNTRQTTVWHEVQEAARKELGPDASVQLAEMSKRFRSMAREYNSKASDLETSVVRRKGQLPEDAGYELIEQYRTQAAKAEAWGKSLRLRSRRTQLLDQIAPLRAEFVTDDKDSQRTTTEQLIALKESCANARAGIELGERLLAAIGQSNACPVCLTPMTTTEEITQRLHQRVAQRNQDLCDGLGQIRSIEHQVSALQEVISHRAQLDRLESELRGIEQALIDVPDKYEGPDHHELIAEIDRLRMSELTRKQLAADSKEIQSLHDSSEICKVLEKEAGKLLKNLLRSVQQDAEDVVNKYMPSNFRAALVIADKAVEWRVIGTDGRAHKRGGMSGSEFGALLVAIACAWTEGSPLRVMLLDDVDLGIFDPDNLKTTLNVLRDAVLRGDLTQVVIGWTRPEEIPSDWHIINTTKGV